MHSRTLPAAALLAAVLPLAVAQSTSNSSERRPSPNEDVIELSPFTVNAQNDTSWTATTTLIGSRTNQELVKVPVTVDVLTSEFMHDVGAFTLEDAARFVAGLTVQPQLENRNDDGRLSYRGFNNTNNTRNFFLWYVPSDTYNVDRYDFNKGSNSLMFGDSTPGGQATIYTKRARRKNFGELYGSIGSYDAHRVQLDVNRELRNNLFVRLNLVDRSNRNYVRGFTDDFRAANLALTYQPFKHTQIRVEGEAGESKRVRADSTIFINDGASTGRGFSINNRWYLTSDGEIVYRNQNANPPSPANAVDRSGTTGVSQSLLMGMSQEVRLPNGTHRTFQGLDKYTNVLGFNDYLNRGFNVFNTTIEQRIGKLALELAYNQQFQHQDRNDNSFGGGNPAVIRVDNTGRPYYEMATSGVDKIFGAVVKAGRVAAAYPFDFGRFGKQFVVLTMIKQRDEGSARRYSIGNELGPGSINNNTLQLRAYFDDPNFGTEAFWAQFRTPNLPQTPTFRAVKFETATSTGPFVDLKYTRSYTASMSGEYFRGRVTTLLGGSWNRLRRKIPKLEQYTTDARGYWVNPGTPDKNPNAYMYDPAFSMQAHSFTIGSSVHVWKSSTLNVWTYGVYSESFNWQARQMFYGPDIGPVLGKTKEVGFKGDVLEGKVRYTLGFFETRRQNSIFNWTPDVLTLAQLQDLMNPNDIDEADPRYQRVVSGPNNERSTVNANERSRGLELTLQGQRWRGLQSRLTFATVSISSAPNLSVFQAYLDAAIKRTEAARAPGGHPLMAEPDAVINNAKTIIGSNTLTDRVAGRRSSPYTASFVLDYEVPFARGVRVGFNGTLTPNYNIRINEGVAWKGAAQFPLHGYAIYNRRIFDRSTTFRLGVQNIHDVINGGSDYRKTAINSFDAGVPKYTYRYMDPTSWSLSVSTRF